MSDNSQRRRLAIKGISAASFTHMASCAVFNIPMTSRETFGRRSLCEPLRAFSACVVPLLLAPRSIGVSETLARPEVVDETLHSLDEMVGPWFPARPRPQGIQPGLVVASSLTGTTKLDGDGRWKAEVIARSPGRAASEPP
jgi:hypothetical protein